MGVCPLVHTLRRILCFPGGNARMRLLLFVVLVCLCLSSLQYLLLTNSSSLSTHAYKPLLVFGLKMLNAGEEEASVRRTLQGQQQLPQQLQNQLLLNNSSMNNTSTTTTSTSTTHPPSLTEASLKTTIRSQKSRDMAVKDGRHASVTRSEIDARLPKPEDTGRVSNNSGSNRNLNSTLSNKTRSSSSPQNQPALKKTRESCKEIPSGLLGKLNIEKQFSLSMEEIVQNNPNVKAGGKFSPSNCVANHRVAIIVPYRNRPDQLRAFLGHLHPFLQRQEIEYGIYIVEQVGITPFNRASLLNIGFVEANKEKSWGCAIFHDVDLLPEDDRNLYTCPQQPRHMSVSVDKFKYKLPYKQIFGGVTAVSTEHFKKLNGYSNEFWGWGGEDDDMSRRIRYHRLKIIRYRPDIARYTMMKHRKEPANRMRMRILKYGPRRYKTDGLVNLRYNLVGKTAEPLYTHIAVSIKPEKPKRGRPNFRVR